MPRRNKKKDTNLFFDSFKHFKNNFCNLICLELPELVHLNDVIRYTSLKPVNYKSKFPDMRKIGLIDYDKPSDNSFSLTEEGEIIYDVINQKFTYDINSVNRLESIEPSNLRGILTPDETEIIQTQLIKLLISYYDTADCIRPYLALIKMIEAYNIAFLDSEMLCLLLAQTKIDILNKRLNQGAFDMLPSDLKEEVKRPISYVINGLETAGIIDDEGNIVYDRNLLRDIEFNLNEIEAHAEETEVRISTGRSADSQRRFREAVLEAYGYKCAITGESISIDKPNNTTSYLLEAAHIIPYSDNGSFSVNNGIALSTEMHKLFDKKLFVFQYTDDGELEIIVTQSEAVHDSSGLLQRLNHQRISLPVNEADCPDPDAIEYRKNNYLL